MSTNGPAIGQVGSGGYFLGTAHIRARFQDAFFFVSELFDDNSFEQRQADGAKDAAAARGLEAARRALERYAAPALDAGVDEALGEFIAARAGAARKAGPSDEPGALAARHHRR